MAEGAFARDLVLGPPTRLSYLWWGAACLAGGVEVWLLLVAPGFAAIGILLIAFALTMRRRAEAGAARIPGLCHSPGGNWYRISAEGARSELFARRTVVMPHAVFVNFRCDAASEAGLAVTRAGAGLDGLRRLRVRLRHGSADAGRQK